jgi:hypothetical protein
MEGGSGCIDPCRSSTPYAKAFAASLPMCSSGSVGYARWASSSMAVAKFCRDWPAFCVANWQWRSVGLWTSPQVPRVSSYGVFIGMASSTSVAPPLSAVIKYIDFPSLTIGCAPLQTHIGARTRSTMYSRWMLAAGLCSHWLLVYFPARQLPWPLPVETGTSIC